MRLIAYPHLASNQEASSLGPVREIHYFEVSRAYVGRGLGTEIVYRLEIEFSDARLIASANTARGFWNSLEGWDRVGHAEGLRGDWALFVSAVSPQRGMGSSHQSSQAHVQ